MWVRPTYVKPKRVGDTRPSKLSSAHNAAMDEKKRIGANIRRLRDAAGMRQVEVAVAGGITRSHLSKVEKGKDGLSVQSLIGIADALGVTIDDLKGVAAAAGGQAPIDREEAAQMTAVMGIFYLLDKASRELAIAFMARLAKSAERKKARAGRGGGAGSVTPHPEIPPRSRNRDAGEAERAPRRPSIR